MILSHALPSPCGYNSCTYLKNGHTSWLPVTYLCVVVLIFRLTKREKQSIFSLFDQERELFLLLLFYILNDIHKVRFR